LGTFGVHLIERSGKVALVAAAVLALALGGCGRKSGLDAPPQAAVQPAPGQEAQPPRTNPLGLFEPDPEPGPTAPPGQKRRLVIDRILD
jgi:predicted small lipoprotein YifL